MSATKRARAAEQAAVAVDRQHDHDRIGAREMLRPCRPGSRASSRLATRWSARRNWRRSDAARASAASPWPRRAAADGPASTRPCTAIERRSVTSRSWRALAPRRLAGRCRCRSAPRRSSRPRKTISRGRAERARLVEREQRIVAPLPAFLQHDHFAADHIGAGARIASASASTAAVSVRRSAARSMRLSV